MHLLRVLFMQMAAALCRKLSFTDACHTWCGRKFHIISLVTIDGNDHIVPVAIGMIRGETVAQCRWFYRCLLNSTHQPFLDWLTDADHVGFADRGNERKALDSIDAIPMFFV